MAIVELCRAAIGCYTAEGSIEAIMTNYNGNPAFTGAILIGKYQTPQKIKQLFDLGDLLILGEELYPNDSKLHILCHRSDTWEANCLQDNVTVAMHRDVQIYINESYKPQRKQTAWLYSSVNDIFVENKNCEFVYVYNTATRGWETYHCGVRIWIDYGPLISNCYERGDINYLSKQEKINVLKNFGKIICNICAS